jgi:hypothetical protein
MSEIMCKECRHSQDRYDCFMGTQIRESNYECTCTWEEEHEDCDSDSCDSYKPSESCKCCLRCRYIVVKLLDNKIEEELLSKGISVENGDKCAKCQCKVYSIYHHYSDDGQHYCYKDPSNVNLHLRVLHEKLANNPKNHEGVDSDYDKADDYYGEKN